MDVFGEGMAECNDIDMNLWREYEDIYTDSLWIIDKRDTTGLHANSYHGNFVPQIPNQLLRRYTKAGEWVLDPFMGSGTTIIEARMLSRNSIGIELQADVAEDVKSRLSGELYPGARYCIAVGDSRTICVPEILEKEGISGVQFVLFHPPYWDIIHFSGDERDISNTPTLEAFLAGFSQVIDNTTGMLDSGRYCAVVIGDKYAKGEVVPLGFLCMNLFLERGFKMKGIIVKNFGETRGKGHNTNLWRYRALAGGFYVFKHEYIFVFKKP